MAKQHGPLLITGTYNGLCYYKLNGTYYVRRKSSLSSRRVKKSPAFKGTMHYAGLLARAAGIASIVYRVVPKKARKREVYRAITGKVMSLLKEGVEADIIIARLEAAYAPAPPLQTAKPAPVKLPRLLRPKVKRRSVSRYHVTVSGALAACAFPKQAGAANAGQDCRLRSVVLSPPYRRKALPSEC